MREWFARLQPRERLILAGGGIAAVVIVSWWLVWRPAAQGAEQLRDAIAEKTRMLEDLQRAETLAPQPGAGQRTDSSGQSLVVLIDSTAQALGLAGSFTRTRPEGMDAISVSFTGAAFGSLVEWLVTLERSHGVSVESASVTAARDPGLVSGQVFLRRR